MSVNINYVCAECSQPVNVAGIAVEATSFARPCGHNTALIHANMSGTLYGTGTVSNGTATICDSLIPDNHRAAWKKYRRLNGVTAASSTRARGWWLPWRWFKKARTWRVRDWYAYLAEYHESQRGSRNAV